MRLRSGVLWLWCRLAAVALIQPPVWERPHAMNVALKDRKKKVITPIANPYDLVVPVGPGSR